MYDRLLSLEKEIKDLILIIDPLDYEVTIRTFTSKATDIVERYGLDDKNSHFNWTRSELKKIMRWFIQCFKNKRDSKGVYVDRTKSESGLHDLTLDICKYLKKHEFKTFTRYISWVVDWMTRHQKRWLDIEAKYSDIIDIKSAKNSRKMERDANGVPKRQKVSPTVADESLLFIKKKGGKPDGKPTSASTPTTRKYTNLILNRNSKSPCDCLDFNRCYDSKSKSEKRTGFSLTDWELLKRDYLVTKLTSLLSLRKDK